MRYGLYWTYLLFLAGVGGVGCAAQNIVATNVQPYNTIATTECTLTKWSGDNSAEQTLWADFKCGDKTITIKNGTLLAKYLNETRRKPLTCTFKVGAILGDQYTNCSI